MSSVRLRSPFIVRNRHARSAVRGAAAVVVVSTLALTLGGFAGGAADLFVDEGIRPIDGVGNNVTHAYWGAPEGELLRQASGPHYGDGISTPAGAARPSPRIVSNAIFAQTGSIPNPQLTDFMWTWGQFLDHDFGLTPGNQEYLPVVVPTGDPFFDPLNSGGVVIPFNRAIYASGSSPRAPINLVTAFIDGSMVYGSEAARANWLRTHTGGRLKTTPLPNGDLLPYNDGTQPNAGSPEVPDFSKTLFVAGDVRVNEQPTLAVMHTLFVREHNYQAAQIAAGNPGLTDEQIYQQARRIVVGEIQGITYEEFVPALLGPGALQPYRGYDPDVNPGLSAVFSTAAYRLGHTLLSPMIQRLQENGAPIPEGPLPLRDAFFASAPPQLERFGLEPFLRGVASQVTQELDSKVIDDVRNFLFGAPAVGGLDLISLNLQRGRDLGLPDFNTVRQDFGLPRKETFKKITSDPTMAAALRSLYGSVDDIDVFAGLLVEDDLPGRIVGETLFRVLADQFERSRSGDRFFYERTLTPQELHAVRASRLSDIIKRNTTIRKIQGNVFRLGS